VNVSIRFRRARQLLRSAFENECTRSGIIAGNPRFQTTTNLKLQDLWVNCVCLTIDETEFTYY